MVSLLLVIIYLAFISLGLPDSLLGSAWPSMYIIFGVEVSSMGIVTMIICCGTIISSLLSDKLIRKFSPGVVTAVSTLLTAISLFLFSVANEFYQICLIALPYGLGAGAIDSALNNYVALHYKGRHMAFLHAFWGLGALASPYIMGLALTRFNSYRLGYQIVGTIQLVLTIILFISLPLWKKVSKLSVIEQEEVTSANLTLKQKLSLPGIFLLLFAFFAYCAFESTCMNWTATYFVLVENINASDASFYASLFFIGMTISRLFTGLINEKLGDRNMIRVGIVIICIGLFLLFISPVNIYITIVSFIVMGIGCGPIYPSIIHSTPFNFKKENSQAVIGLQMAFAYMGATFMPPLYGLIANYIAPNLLKYYLLFLLVLLFVMSELLNHKVNKRINKETAINNENN